MDVSKNSGTLEIIHFNRVFHYKPSNLGYPYFWKHPYKGGSVGTRRSSKELIDAKKDDRDDV